MLLFPAMSTIITLSGILCTYFLVNGVKGGHFPAIWENNDKMFLYFAQHGGYRRNSDIFCSYVFARFFPQANFCNFPQVFASQKCHCCHTRHSSIISGTVHYWLLLLILPLAYSRLPPPVLFSLVLSLPNLSWPGYSSVSAARFPPPPKVPEGCQERPYPAHTLVSWRFMIK